MTFLYCFSYSFKKTKEFYSKFPQYKEPGNYIIELVQKDAGNGMQALAFFMLLSTYHSEVAESLLKQYIPADVRKALSWALKLREDLNFIPGDIEKSPVEICQVNIAENDTTQVQNYKPTTIGDLNLDTDLF